MNELKILLIGYGKMAQMSHVPTLSHFDGAKVVGVVRQHHEPVPGVPVFTSLEQALEIVRPTITIVSSPHVLHYEHTITCLRAGCHVLVDKPLALNFGEARCLVEEARRQGKLLVIGQQRRYEGIGYLRDQSEWTAMVGNVLAVHGLFSHRFGNIPETHWRNDPKRQGAGILDDSFIHLLDLALFIAKGPIVNVSSNVLGPKEAPHTVNCLLRNKDGISLALTASYLSPVDSVQEEMSVWGSRGCVFLRRFCIQANTAPPPIYYKSLDGTDTKTFDTTKYPSGRALPLEAFLKDVAAGGTSGYSSRTNAEACMETYRVIEQIKNEHGINVEP